MLLSGVVTLYPLIRLCLLAVIIAIFYSGYPLYPGIPGFLGIDRKEGGYRIRRCIGVLVLAATVLLREYGDSLFRAP